jgi:DTW domain-containing protein YfiP
MLRRNPRKSKAAGIPTCHICGLWDHFCVCDLLPSIRSKVGFILIQHSSELLRQSNTARLAEKMISPCEIVSWGSPEIPYRDGCLKNPDHKNLVLYPRPENRLLNKDDCLGDNGEPTNLILLDATWAQAKSMSRRIPGLPGFTFVSLPEQPPPSWKLRRSPGKGYFCTLEAVIRAMAIIDGDQHVRALELSLELVMARGLHMRGKINKLQMERTCRPIIERLQSMRLSTDTREG